MRTPVTTYVTCSKEPRRYREVAERIHQEVLRKEAYRMKPRSCRIIAKRDKEMSIWDSTGWGNKGPGRMKYRQG